MSKIWVPSLPEDEALVNVAASMSARGSARIPSSIHPSSVPSSTTTRLAWRRSPKAVPVMCPESAKACNSSWGSSRATLRAISNHVRRTSSGMQLWRASFIRSLMAFSNSSLVVSCPVPPTAFV